MINTETEIERGDSVCLLHLLNKKDNCKKKKKKHSGGKEQDNMGLLVGFPIAP